MSGVTSFTPLSAVELKLAPTRAFTFHVGMGSSL